MIMHDYSLDNHCRRTVHFAAAVVSVYLPHAFVFIAGKAFDNGGISYPLSVGATFSILYLLFERCLWKKLQSPLGVPDLSGTWKARGLSCHTDEVSGERIAFEMECRIKQTFSKIEVFAETEHSTSRSFMASIESNHAVAILYYAFENTPKNMSDPELQRHSGLIELRITDSTHMSGDYFTGKHRLKYGELTLTKI